MLARSRYAALALALATTTTGTLLARADTSRGIHTAAARPIELPGWIRDLQAGELDLDRALVGAIELGRAASAAAVELRTGAGPGPDLALELFAHLLGPRHGAAELMAVVLEPPRILTTRPVPGAPTSAFGYRRDPIRHRRTQNHKGIDLRAARNTPVHVAGDGVVALAGRLRGYGRVVYVDHGGGLETRYAHLQSIAVTEGQTLIAGQLVGRVGSSGRATGPHLHFEIRIDDVPVAPDQVAGLGMFAAPEGPIVAAIAPLLDRGRRMADSAAAAAPTPRARPAVKARPKRRAHGRPARRELRSQRPQT